MSPFIRKVHASEIWYYKNPRTASYISTNTLYLVIFVIPLIAFAMDCLLKKRCLTVYVQGLWAFSLSILLTGTVTNAIKVIVGRHRPDFFYRCFPDGLQSFVEDGDVFKRCSGLPSVLEEGRKSFPSGHSSFSFCGFMFLSLWLCGNLKVFNGVRSRGWKLVLALSPLLAALMIALSRTCDYHHHWQDVLVGSIIGLTIAYLCYRTYFPSLHSDNCDLPYILFHPSSGELIVYATSDRRYKNSELQTDIRNGEIKTV